MIGRGYETTEASLDAALSEKDNGDAVLSLGQNAIRSVREACVLIYPFISALSTACLRILVSIPVPALYGPPERPAVVPLFSTTSQNKSVARYHRIHPSHSLLRRYPECPDSIASYYRRVGSFYQLFINATGLLDVVLGTSATVSVHVRALLDFR
jgi:hypothetical protein